MDTNIYLITGSAGFIGYHLSRMLLEKGCQVIGFDNLNDYYDVTLKDCRLASLTTYQNFHFIKGDLANEQQVDQLFAKFKPDIVVNLAAQAGVRYSIENPRSYLNSNMIGFFNIIEACRNYQIKHLIYASSSSVYGNQQKAPFSVMDKTDQPVSLYAATKKSNELMAFAYSHLYEIPATGLRFFTVYGPLGRPDMAYFSFTKKILAGEPIQIYNHGNMYRDFTYVDDIVAGIGRILCNPPTADSNGDKHKVYNIGNNQPIKLLDFVETLETLLGKETEKILLPMQPGDVYQTYADIDDLVHDFDFRPKTSIAEGLHQFVTWYQKYYNLN